MLTRRSLATAALIPLALASPAYAKDGPATGVGGCANDFFCVDVEVPGKPGGSGQEGQAGGSNASSKPPKTECTTEKMEPQPPAGSGVWQGNDPEDGAIYIRSCRFYTDTGASMIDQEAVYAPNGTAPAPVNPAVLAQQAVDKMLLRGPAIGITPRPGGKGVVGMPVYLWTERGAETYGPNTATASAGGVTVTATAKVERIVWAMGDGKSVTCTTAGTPYKASYGKKPSPDCGHRYNSPSSTEPSGKFHVTATSTWTIDWTGGGQSGQLTETRDGAVDITVAEVQVLS